MDALEDATGYDIAALLTFTALVVVWFLYPAQPVRVVLVLAGFTVLLGWGAFALQRAVFGESA